MQLEGIVSKRRSSPYETGRGAKLAQDEVRASEEFVIVGFTDPAGTRQGFGSNPRLLRQGGCASFGPARSVPALTRRRSGPCASG